MKEVRKNLRGPQRVCPVCGKVHTFCSAEGLCEKHYHQKLRYGEFLDNSPRSIYDPNEYKIDGDITYISVYDKRGVELPEKVIIDTKNIPLILPYKVYIRSTGTNKHGTETFYACCSISRNKKVKVHQIVCQGSNNVDHVNGNTLDNRECNLRPSNMTMQNLNKITSKGIQKQIHACNGKNEVTGYAATMGYNRKRYISKYYKTEEEAQYYRYLLLQMLPFKTNYDLSFMEKLSQEQKDAINEDFTNRFKNRVL